MRWKEKVKRQGVRGERERVEDRVEVCIFFFFKQKTAYEIYQCDWSSDVCSSDLALRAGG